ncbi:glycosyltransferase family 4 protein [Bacillus sp. ISL-4]|uniref:glycosyltransferase family 4 protein n=1 Tax=Bacillus sp. ISL-4 TaxID=2819125 RepID=UPI001BE5E2B8|nr:glycosyltransferase family 4 protein [Bacillus sp. ISL-4]MBT2667492.1 glycosyltransferase family 4 protein [Bacillus sp. ISL-4]MBT2672969.1 glycosyltransferase family 4 protein [Streptomyces sp. ISL-14]
MKVMVLSSYAPTLFFFREDMMAAMIMNGHEVIAAAPESEKEWENKFKKRNIKYVSIKGIERTGSNPVKDIIGFISILKTIFKEKPDKVIAYQAKTIAYGCIAANILRVKGIYAIMGGLGSIIRNNSRKSLARDILKTEYKVAFSFCDNVFFQNKDDCNEAINNNLIKNEKIVMINGSGVNLKKFTEKQITKDPIFLFVGRLLKDKGINEYIQAAEIVKEKYPNARIQILGSFDTNPTAIKEDDIYKYVKKGIIEYLGSTDDVRPFLETCRFFVLPSYHEGTSKSMLEAMATGRPILTTDAPGCRETVIDGINGLLVPVANVDKLAEKMIWLIENTEEAERMGQEGLRICKEKYDVQKVNEIILKTMNLKA